jgi:transposase
MSTKESGRYSQVSKYSESFKMTVVSEVLTGYISETGAQKKYGIGGHCTISKWIKKYGSNKEIKQIIKVRMPNDKTKIKELQTRLHKLEHLVTDLQLEKRALEKLIELTEREYKIKIKKNSGVKPSLNSERNLEG